MRERERNAARCFIVRLVLAILDDHIELYITDVSVKNQPLIVGPGYINQNSTAHPGDVEGHLYFFSIVRNDSDCLLAIVGHHRGVLLIVLGLLPLLLLHTRGTDFRVYIF